MPDSLLPQLQAARAFYGGGMTNDECVALLNAVAYTNPGWGLLAKPSGNNGTIDGLGAAVSIDHLVYQPLMRGIDVLSDAGNGGPSVPGWGDVESGEQFPADRFVAPIRPAGVPVPSPGPGPVPPPPEPSAGDLAKILQAVIDANEALDALAAVQEAMTIKLEDLTRQVTALAARPWPAYRGDVHVKFLGAASVDLQPVQP